MNCTICGEGHCVICVCGMVFIMYPCVKVFVVCVISIHGVVSVGEGRYLCDQHGGKGYLCVRPVYVL